MDRYEQMLTEIKSMAKSVEEYKKLDFNMLKCIDILNEFQYDFLKIVNEIIRLREQIGRTEEEYFCNECEMEV